MKFKAKKKPADKPAKKAKKPAVKKVPAKEKSGGEPVQKAKKSASKKVYSANKPAAKNSNATRAANKLETSGQERRQKVKSLHLKSYAKETKCKQ